MPARSSPGGRPRLLVITPDFPPARGGIQISIHRIVAGLQRLEPHVVTLDQPGARAFDAGAGFEVVRVPRTPGPAALASAALNVGALLAAARLRPQVTLSAHIVASPAMALIAAATGAPGVQCYYAKEIGRRPRLAAFAARRAAAIVSISSYTTGLLTRVGVPPERARLIAPGVDPPAAVGGGDERRGRVGADVVAHEDSIPAERPTVLTVARLADRYKGHDVMLRALALVRAQVPDVEWVVVGDGPLRGELEARARETGVAASVRFLGAVSDAERDAWLRRCQLLAMPSRLPPDGAGEGFGIVYLEAAAHGKPVVAGNVGGAVDAVGDGETGLLVDPTDAEAVAGAIVRLLSDPELARRLGAAGAARAKERAWPLVAARYEELLLATLDGART